MGAPAMEPGDWLTSVYSLFISSKGLKLRLTIPDTIFISEGTVQSWFRTNEHGYIARVSLHATTLRHFHDHLCSRPIQGAFNPHGYVALAHFHGGHSELLTQPELAALMQTMSDLSARPPRALEPNAASPGLTVFEDGTEVYLPFAVQAYIPSPTDLRFLATYFLEPDGALCSICTRRYSPRYIPDPDAAPGGVRRGELAGPSPVRGAPADDGVWDDELPGEEPRRLRSPDSPLPHPPSTEMMELSWDSPVDQPTTLGLEARAVDLRSRGEVRRAVQHMASFVEREHRAIMSRVVVEFVQGPSSLYMLLVQRAEFAGAAHPSQRERLHKLMSPRWATEMRDRPLSAAARSGRSVLSRGGTPRPRSAALIEAGGGEGGGGAGRGGSGSPLALLAPAKAPPTPPTPHQRRPLYTSSAASPGAGVWGSKVNAGPSPAAPMPKPPASPRSPVRPRSAVAQPPALSPQSSAGGARRPVSAVPGVPSWQASHAPYSPRDHAISLPQASMSSNKGGGGGDVSPMYPSGDWVPRSANRISGSDGTGGSWCDITSQLVGELEEMREAHLAKTHAAAQVEEALERERKERAVEAESLRLELTSSLDELSTVKGAHSEVVGQVGGLQTEAQDLRSRVTEVCRDFDKVKRALEVERKAAAEARVEHAETERAWEAERERLAREREEAVGETSRLRAEVAAGLEEVADLRERLKESMERVEFLQVVVSKVEAERDALRVSEQIHGTSDLEWNSKLGFKEDPDVLQLRREMAMRAEMVKMAQGAQREDGSAAPPLQLNIKDILLYSDTDGMQLLKAQVLLRQNEHVLRDIYTFYCFLGKVSFRLENPKGERAETGEGTSRSPSPQRRRELSSPAAAGPEAPERAASSGDEVTAAGGGAPEVDMAGASGGEGPRNRQGRAPYRGGIYVKSTAPVTASLSLHQFGRFAVDTGVLNLRSREVDAEVDNVAKVFAQVAEEATDGVLECHFLGFLRAVCRLAELKYKGSHFLKEVESPHDVKVHATAAEGDVARPVTTLKAFLLPRTAATSPEGGGAPEESPLWVPTGQQEDTARPDLQSVVARVESYLLGDVIGHARRPKVAGSVRNSHKIFGDGGKRVQQEVQIKLLPKDIAHLARKKGVPES